MAAVADFLDLDTNDYLEKCCWTITTTTEVYRSAGCCTVRLSPRWPYIHHQPIPPRTRHAHSVDPVKRLEAAFESPWLF